MTTDRWLALAAFAGGAVFGWLLVDAAWHMALVSGG